MPGTYQNYFEYRSRLESGQISCTQEVNRLLKIIEDNRHLNAFLEVFSDEAIERAGLIDRKIKSGEAGRLAGMIIGLKDNICYAGHKVSAASKILENFESLYSATAVERLVDEDAIIIGRLNCDEFAMGSSNENSAYGPVINPVDNKSVPGGSSGGSAAAVAAGLCHAALGSDTGGSIRQPASFTGTVGLKPTYGRISRWGLIAYGSSLDQIGPITNSVADAALLLEIMAGADDYDTTASTEKVVAYSQKLDFKGKARIAYLKEAVESKGLSEAAASAFRTFVSKLESEGHTVEAVDFPLLDYLVPAYYIISNAEASSNLARYDGINYGYRSENATDISTTFEYSRSEAFGPEVKRRIMMGTFVLSAGYYDAYYAKAQKVRRLLKDRTTEILNNYDFIMTPTTPHSAFLPGSHKDDPVAMYLEDIFTVHANLAGIPAVSLPYATGENGLPLGVQLASREFEEGKLLSFAHSLGF